MLYIADKGYIWIMAGSMHAQCVKDNIPKYTNVKQWECELDIAIYSLGLSKALLSRLTLSNHMGRFNVSRLVISISSL